MTHTKATIYGWLLLLPAFLLLIAFTHWPALATLHASGLAGGELAGGLALFDTGGLIVLTGIDPRGALGKGAQAGQGKGGGDQGGTQVHDGFFQKSGVGW